MGTLSAAILTLGCFVYIFWPERNPFQQAQKTRLDYLAERKQVIYDNLRDLNFEYLAGKYPEQDYSDQRSGLEDEAIRVMEEMTSLEASSAPRRSASSSRASG